MAKSTTKIKENLQLFSKCTEFSKKSTICNAYVLQSTRFTALKTHLQFTTFNHFLSTMKIKNKSTFSPHPPSLLTSLTAILDYTDILPVVFVIHLFNILDDDICLPT